MKKTEVAERLSVVAEGRSGALSLILTTARHITGDVNLSMQLHCY